MKSLNQIRAALMEAAQDTEAHFVQPTEAQHSIGPMRRQDKEEVKEEGGDEEIGPGTQLRTSDGVYCEIDEIDRNDSNYAWCTDEDGGDIRVNLNTAIVIRIGRPRYDREDQDTSMHEASDSEQPMLYTSSIKVPANFADEKFAKLKALYPKVKFIRYAPKNRRVYGDRVLKNLVFQDPSEYDSFVRDAKEIFGDTTEVYDLRPEMRFYSKQPTAKTESALTNRTTRNRSHTDPLAGIEDYIKDYRESDDPRFEGKSKAERIKMAVSDFYKANPEKNEGAIAESMDGGHQAEEISMTRLELDEIADMADDLFHVLPNFDEVPAWVQHKIAAMHAGLHSIYDYYRLKGIERDQCSKGGLEVITIATPQNPVVQPAPVSPAPMD